MPLREKPDSAHGYVAVIATFLIMMLAWGTLYSFGVFFKPLLNEFGWNRTITSTAFSLSMLLYGIISILMGRLNDRYGPKIVISICGLFLGLGYLMMSQVSAVWQLYLFYGLIGVGISGSFVPMVSTVARWFKRRRGMMTGIGISGAGIGTIVVPPIAGLLIVNYGWRTSYMITGVVTFMIMVGIAQFLHRNPGTTRLPQSDSKVGEVDINKLEACRIDFRQAIQTIQFWLLCSLLFCFGFTLQVIMVHIVPHATDLGILDTTAASILATIGGMSILGRIIMGGVSDKIGNKAALNICFILLLGALAWLLFSNRLWMLYVFAVVFGLGYGGFAPLTSLIVAQLFGLSSHGTILGGAEILYTIGAAIGPAIAGRIFDITGDYQVAFLTSAFLIVLALILVTFLRPLTCKRGKT